MCVVDVRMPPTFLDEGLRAALVIRNRWPDVGVLVLSQYVEERYATELLAGRSEAVGYLLKDRVADLRQFAEAVRRVAEGGAAFDPEVVSQLLARTRHVDPLSRLSPRESEVLQAMAEGRSKRRDRAAPRGRRRRRGDAHPEHLQQARPRPRRGGASSGVGRAALPGRLMGQPLGRPRRLVLGVGLVLLVPLLLAGAYLTVALLQGTRHYDFSRTSAAATALNVHGDNTAVSLDRSPDEKIHVVATGSYTGKAPTVRLSDTASGITVTARCSSSLVQRCTLRLRVSMPAATPVSVQNDDGSITASGLTGSLQLHSTNGGLHVTGGVGALDLRTVNGSIDGTSLRSASTVVSTFNGDLRLTFSDVPSSVEADTTNGQVTVQLPGTEFYSVDADTVPTATGR